MLDIKLVDIPLNGEYTSKHSDLVIPDLILNPVLCIQTALF